MSSVFQIATTRIIPTINLTKLVSYEEEFLHALPNLWNSMVKLHSIHLSLIDPVYDLDFKLYFD